MALSAGGRSAAICSPLKPPQELPMMPTLPVHHGWAAIQAMAASAVVQFLLAGTRRDQAVGIAGAARSRRAAQA